MSIMKFILFFCSTHIRRYLVYPIISSQIEQYRSKQMSYNTVYVIYRQVPATKCKHLPYSIIGSHWRILVAILQQVSFLNKTTMKWRRGRQNELYSWKMMWFNQLFYYTRDPFENMCHILKDMTISG